MLKPEPGFHNQRPLRVQLGLLHWYAVEREPAVFQNNRHALCRKGLETHLSVGFSARQQHSAVLCKRLLRLDERRRREIVSADVQRPHRRAFRKTPHRPRLHEPEPLRVHITRHFGVFQTLLHLRRYQHHSLHVLLQGAHIDWLCTHRQGRRHWKVSVHEHCAFRELCIRVHLSRPKRLQVQGPGHRPHCVVWTRCHKRLLHHPQRPERRSLQR